jgi:choline dehydrogenase-like flavoprotein
MDDGIMLVGVFGAPNILAATYPGVGPEHVAYARRLKNTAIFGGLIHDEGGGEVRPHVGREPLLTYRMDPDDKRRMLRGLGIVARIAFAAGAREVMLPFFGLQGFTNLRDLEDALAYAPRADRMESVAFHPLGSARMACNARIGVVRTSGESWEMPGLYVADGSVLPTSIGVNSQLPIMAIATMIGRGLVRDFDRHRRAIA